MREALAEKPQVETTQAEARRLKAELDALANPLAMLEALVKRYGEIHTTKWWISYDKHTEQFTYRRYLYYSFGGNSIPSTRAEAEALLKGGTLLTGENEAKGRDRKCHWTKNS